MKNDLSCGVVRDLLPSYIEGLLGEDSREAVDRHLETCPACTAEKEAMASPTEEVKVAEAEETAKEVDFLRRVKKGTARKITLAVACTALILLGGIALKLFVIGTPLQPQSLAVVLEEVQDEGNTLFLSLSSVGSGNAFHSWKVETVDGVASIYARDVLVSPLYSTSNAQVYVPLEGVREVWLGGISGRLVWQEGLIIHPDTLRMLETKTPYCGDPAALGRILDALQLQEFTGGHTISLQTRERPYVLTLKFEKRISPFIIWDWTECYFFQILALVDNLDEVVYAFDPERDSGKTVTGGRVTVEYATEVMAKLTESHNLQYGTDWPIHENFKEYAESPLEYQRMMTLLEESRNYKQGYPLIWSDSSGRS